MRQKKTAAICLAAGKGKRMESTIQKQYLLLQGKPILYYSLKALQDSSIEEIILVVGAGEEEYCRKEIVEKYRLTKVKAVVTGGRERFHSVYCGLMALEDCELVLIHDGARPFLSGEIICNCIQGTKEHQACVAAVPSKDTIKLADRNQDIETTPDRSRVWIVQTPQAFSYSLIKEAYDQLLEAEEKGNCGITITDDAMAVEYFLQKKVHLVMGSYRNIKITTPEDMWIAAALLEAGP